MPLFIILMLHYILPVSYTHLDVYKRQAIEYSMSVDFGEDRLRGKGSLPETFFVVTRVKYLILINKVS